MTEPPIVPPYIQAIPSKPGEKKSVNKSIFVIAGVVITAFIIVLVIVGALLIIGITSKEPPEEVTEEYVRATLETYDAGAIEKLIKPSEVDALKQLYGDDFANKVVEIYCVNIGDTKTDFGFEFDYNDFSYTTSYEEDAARVTVILQGTMTMADDSGWSKTIRLDESHVPQDYRYNLEKEGNQWYVSPHYKYSIFLSAAMPLEDAQALVNEIEGSEYSLGAEVEYSSKEDALEEMKGTVPNNPGWSEWLEGYDNNPFPSSITIESTELRNLIHIRQNVIEGSRFEAYVKDGSLITAVNDWQDF